MDLSEYVKEFRALQKTQKVRVADFCRERTHTVWEIPKLYQIVNHLMRCRVNGKKVWAKIPESPLGQSLRGVRYNVNMILRKYLCGNAECNTEKSQQYEIGIDISRKTVNTSINKMVS